MRVYILEVGAYRDTYTEGVFSSLEAATAALHVTKPAPWRSRIGWQATMNADGSYTKEDLFTEHKDPHSYEWVIADDKESAYFDGNPDWGDSACVRSYELNARRKCAAG